MTHLPVPSTRPHDRTETRREAGHEAGYIETYYADGTWCSRRYDSDIPFAAGDEELEQIALGSQVARWNRLPHIIRAADGSIRETIPAP
ncbi:hypothetical protein ACWEOO_32440 [Kribbella sp. NPDC004138]